MFFLLSTSISTLKQLVCDRLLNQAFEGGGREQPQKTQTKPISS